MYSNLKTVSTVRFRSSIINMKANLSKLNPKNFTKRAKIIFWIVIVVGIILIAALIYGIYASMNSLENTDNVYTVATGDITQEVTGSGTCSPVDLTTLKATVTGQVDYVNYNAGSLVGPGDTIVHFKTGELDYTLQKAQLAYDQAQIEYDNAPDDERNLADIALETAQAEVDNVNSTFAMYNVSSPVSGMVYQVLVTPDQYVAAGEDVAIVGSNSQYEVTFKVDENYINQIAVGQTANITISSAQPTQFQGKVIELNLVGDTSTTGITTYEVKISFDLPENAKIYDGMNANISIIVAQKNGVVVVPENYVNSDGTVTVVDQEGNTNNVSVHIGISDNNNVEIVSGLKAGDVIIRTTTSGSSD